MIISLKVKDGFIMVSAEEFIHDLISFIVKTQGLTAVKLQEPPYDPVHFWALNHFTVVQFIKNNNNYDNPWTTWTSESLGPLCWSPTDHLLVQQQQIKNVLRTCESYCSSWRCSLRGLKSFPHQNTANQFQVWNRWAHLHNIHQTGSTANRLPDKMCRPQQIPARSSSARSSLRTCLPCQARRKERRHHFDCSPQPRHCRSTVCQAHSLLVSKISHSDQEKCRVEHRRAHTATSKHISFTLLAGWTPPGYSLWTVT